MPGSDRTFATEYREVLEMVRLAETLGFDSAWISEHHGAGDGYLPSLMPMLAAMAAVTERVRLGTGVLLTPFHDPLRLAEDAAFVDQLSGGRLILGLGLGWREEEFRMFGQQPNERVRRAGRIGDGYIRTRSSPDTWAEGVALAEQGAREAGKDPADLGYAQLQNGFPWADGDAWEVIREGARHHIGVYSGWAEGSDTPGNGFWVSPPPDDVLRHVNPAGPPQEIARTLRQMIEPFRDRKEFHLIIRLHYPGMDFATASRAIELFGEQVIPALKGS